MVRINTLIFDLDGTLVDTKNAIIASVNAMLRDLDMLEKSNKDIISYIGTGVEDLVRQALGKDTKDIIKRGVDIFGNHFNERKKEIKFFPHVRETLLECQRLGKKLFVVTNQRKKSAVEILTIMGIHSLFTDVIGGDNEVCSKPTPCPINTLLARYRLNPHHVMMVGDMIIDIQAGKRAKVITCGVTYGIGRKEDIIVAKPDYCIDDFKEIINIIS